MRRFIAILAILVMGVWGCSSEPEPTPVTTPEPVVEEVAAPEPEPEPVVQGPDHEIIILGKAGFDPLEATVNAGDSIAWINNDEKDVTLTIFQGRKFIQNSDVIEPGEAFEYSFEEPGEYNYWTIGYGPVDAKVIVE